MNRLSLRVTLLAALLLSAAGSAFAVNARLYNLGDRSITTALTGQVITSGVSAAGVAQSYIDRLEGAQAATIQANFTYGSSGSTVKVDVETSLDQGTTWIGICRLAFTTASAEKLVNISSLTPKIAAYTPSTPSDDTCVDGLIGDRIRASVTSTGTYAGNTSVSVRMNLR